MNDRLSDRIRVPAQEPEQVLVMAGQERTLSRLMGAMDEGARWVLLLGPRGIGKSIILRRLQAEFEPIGADAVIIDGLQGMDADELLVSLSAELDLPRRRRRILRRSRSVAGLVASRRARMKPLVLLVDDAHALPAPSLALLATLAAKRMPEGAELYVVLAGTAAIEWMAMRAWGRSARAGRVAKFQLAPLSRFEVQQFVQQRVPSGDGHAITFSEVAMQRIAKHSDGIPGLIDALCERAIVHPSSRRSGQVSPATVDEIADELELRPSRSQEAWDQGGAEGDEPSEREGSERSGERPLRRVARLALVATTVMVMAGAVAFVGMTLPYDSLAWLFGDRSVEITRPPQSNDGGARMRPDGRRELPSRSAGPARAERPGAPSPSARQAGNVTPSPPAKAEQASASRERSAALLTGAREGQLDNIKELLASGVSPNVRDASSFTPLMLSAVRGHVPAIHALLDRGADINARSRGGVTPAMLAVINDRPEALRALLGRGADVNARSGAGWTILTYAAWKGDPELVRALMRHGANPDLVDKQGWTPREYATWMMDCPGRSASRGEEGGEADGGRAPCGRHSEVVPLLRVEKPR